MIDGTINVAGLASDPSRHVFADVALTLIEPRRQRQFGGERPNSSFTIQLQGSARALPRLRDPSRGIRSRRGHSGRLRRGRPASNRQPFRERSLTAPIYTDTCRGGLLQKKASCDPGDLPPGAFCAIGWRRYWPKR